jgi:hypothetical protein
MTKEFTLPPPREEEEEEKEIGHLLRNHYLTKHHAAVATAGWQRTTMPLW